MTAHCTTCGRPLDGTPIAAVDWPEFGTRIRMEMARRNLSYRQLAELIGVDQATIHRVAKHGKPAKVDNYLALAAWCAA